MTARMAWHAGRRMFVRLCGLVAELHARGIAHCDLKPDNVLVKVRGARPSGQPSQAP